MSDSDDNPACRFARFCGRQSTERIVHPTRREIMWVCEWHLSSIRRAFGRVVAYPPEVAE